MTRTYTEWKVTGEPGHPFPTYHWECNANYQELEGLSAEDAEALARSIVNTSNHPWEEGPHLYKRTVTRTDWEEVNEDPTNPTQ